MRSKELKAKLLGGALAEYRQIYRDTEKQTERFIGVIEAFEERYGDERDISVFSVPGRSEISGNHTDHNGGCVLAGAIDRDIVAVAAKNNDGIIRIHSEGYPECEFRISEADSQENFEYYTSRALIGGVVRGFSDRGRSVGGYDAYFTSQVLRGSGLSSSAAYEVMVGNILNHLYNGGVIENTEIARIAQ